MVDFLLEAPLQKSLQLMNPHPKLKRRDFRKPNKKRQSPVVTRDCLKQHALSDLHKKSRQKCREEVRAQELRQNPLPIARG